MGEDEFNLQTTLWVIFTLCINMGLIDSVIGQYPEHVQEGWSEKLALVREWAEREIEEVQRFGEAFDEETKEGK